MTDKSDLGSLLEQIRLRIRERENTSRSGMGGAVYTGLRPPPIANAMTPAELEAIRARDVQWFTAPDPTSKFKLKKEVSDSPPYDRRALLSHLDEQAKRIEMLEAALGMMWDKWENGDACYDEADPGGIYMGQAFLLSGSEQEEILALIPSRAALAAGKGE